MSALARLFVALDLPPAVVEALVAWRAPLLATDAGLRAVAPAALHVTLCFLGERPEQSIAPLGGVVEAVAGPAGGLALGAALWLPQRRPRVLAVALEDRHGELGALQERLMAALTRDGFHEQEPDRAPRPYLPHVTVARVRGREGPSPRRRLLPDPPSLAFDGVALALYRSHPEPAGARYEPQARVALA